MDKITKALRKLSAKQRQRLLEAFTQLMSGNAEGLDVKKLKGSATLYRLRVGDTRLVFDMRPGEEPRILFVGKRDEQTYRDF